MQMNKNTLLVCLEFCRSLLWMRHADSLQCLCSSTMIACTLSGAVFFEHLLCKCSSWNSRTASVPRNHFLGICLEICIFAIPKKSRQMIGKKGMPLHNINWEAPPQIPSTQQCMTPHRFTMQFPVHHRAVNMLPNRPPELNFLGCPVGPKSTS